jgi:hypothetical protein
MSRARGKVEKLDLVQVAGIDTRVWQKEGTSTDNLGVAFSLNGEVVKTQGIVDLIEWGEQFGDKSTNYLWSTSGIATPFYDPLTGRTLPIVAIGAFAMNGAVEILIEYDGKIAVVRGNKLETIASGRHIAKKASEATQFLQVGDIVLILNGRNPNIKWDGVKVSPLGIASVPGAPIIAEAVSRSGAVAFNTAVTNDPSTFIPGLFIQKIDGETTTEYQYKMTWVSESGQESEAGGGSNIVTNEGVDASSSTKGYYMLVAGLSSLEAPSDDIIGRWLYRGGMGGFGWGKLAYLPGISGDTYLDVNPTDWTTIYVLPPVNWSLPPPLAKFAAFFRGRVFYGGNPENPTHLYYSHNVAIAPPGLEGGIEAVAQPGNTVQIASPDGGDYITGIEVAGDYALVFTQETTHMLSVAKDGSPVVTPMSQTVGCVSNRAAVSFENKVFFMSRSGLYAFDGNKPVPISSAFSTMVMNMPQAHLRETVAWVNPSERRANFSVSTGPGASNNEVWSVHVDTGAVSRLPFKVTDAAPYKGETLVAYTRTERFGPATAPGVPVEVSNIGVWGCQNAIAGDEEAITGQFDTRWAIGKNPQADKTFYRADVFYVQTGDISVSVKWFTDWDRDVVGSSSFNSADPDALVWDGTLADGTTARTWDNAYPVGTAFTAKTWDERRIRSTRINLSSSPDSDPSGEELTAKSIKFRFETLTDDTPWRLVGLILYYSDHGARSEGTDL